MEEDDGYHYPHRGEQFYDYNRLDRHRKTQSCQPNGYIKDVVDRELVLVAFYDEPDETEVLLRLDETVEWSPNHKRWYKQRTKSNYFRNKLMLYRARKAGLIPQKEIP